MQCLFPILSLAVGIGFPPSGLPSCLSFRSSAPREGVMLRPDRVSYLRLCSCRWFLIASRFVSFRKRPLWRSLSVFSLVFCFWYGVFFSSVVLVGFPLPSFLGGFVILIRLVSLLEFPTGFLELESISPSIFYVCVRLFAVFSRSSLDFLCVRLIKDYFASC